MEKKIAVKPLKIGHYTIKYPIIQGGMGVGISLSSLAGAVANSGGIGIISTAQIGFKKPEFVKNPLAANLKAIHEEFAKARKIAPEGVLGFNIMVATKEYGQYVKEAVKAGANVIISGAGLPVDMPKFVAEAEEELRADGIKNQSTMIAPIVSSVKSATVICRMWDRKHKTAPDFVVIEGSEAGGHLGFKKDDLLNHLLNCFTISGISLLRIFLSSNGYIVSISLVFGIVYTLIICLSYPILGYGIS